MTTRRRPMRLDGRWAALLVAAVALGAIAPMIGTADLDGAPSTNIDNKNCVCHTFTGAPGGAAGPHTALNVSITGPEEVVVNSTDLRYEVIMSLSAAGPSSRWGFGADLGGKATDGARIRADVPSEVMEGGAQVASRDYLSSSQFNLTLTAPKKPGTLELTVMGMHTDVSGSAAGDQWNLFTKSITVLPQRLVNLTVQVDNTGGAEATDIVAEFSVDGLYVGNGTLKNLVAGGSGNLSYEWDASYFAPGDYLVTAQVHAGQGQVELDSGNNRLDQIVTLKPLQPKERPPPEPVRDLLTSKIMIVVYVTIGMVITVGLTARWLR